MKVKNQIFVGNKPQPSRFEGVKNRDCSSKPDGGFWTSPELDDGMSQFIKYEGGGLVDKEDIVWRLYPKSSVRVKRVKSVGELENLPSKEGNSLSRRRVFIDFEKFFSKGYDGLFISEDVAYMKGFDDNYNLSGWDIDTILWNNLEWIDRVERLGKLKELL